MKSVTRLLLLLKGIAFLATMSAAAQAESILRHVDPAELKWWTWGFILVFSTIGWAVAELDKLAEILEPEGMTRQQHLRAKLKYGQGYLASLGAGVSAYFLAKSGPAAATATGIVSIPGDIPEMMVLLMVFAAGYGGIRFVQWMAARWTPGSNQGPREGA